MRVLLVAAAALLVSAPAASADTSYGGSALVKGSLAAPYIGLVRHDDGRISGRLAIAYRCRSHFSSNLVARLTGKTADGVNFTAAGSTRLSGVGRLRYTLTGTLAPDAVGGKVKLSVRGCRGYTRPFSLRTESAPAGAPAAPPKSTVFAGLTSQAAAGVRLPVVVRVAANGRVYGTWTATMKCGPKAVLAAGGLDAADHDQGGRLVPRRQDRGPSATPTAPPTASASASRAASWPTASSARCARGCRRARRDTATTRATADRRPGQRAPERDSVRKRGARRS